MKVPMSPAEFDARCRRWERLMPLASATSGQRSGERNREVGGHPESKHLFGMARDYVIPEEDQAAGQDLAEQFGFWWKPYAHGIHLQGLPPGEVPDWWNDLHGMSE